VGEADGMETLCDISVSLILDGEAHFGPKDNVLEYFYHLVTRLIRRLTLLRLCLLVAWQG
jgi:hypothetical protein